MSSDSRSTCSSSSHSNPSSLALSESSLTSTNTSPSFHPTLPPKQFIARTSTPVSKQDLSFSIKQDLLLSMKMESIQFSQEYYLRIAAEKGISLSSSHKTLNPHCHEFKPKSSMYSGIHANSTPPSPPSHPARPSRPSRPKKKDHVRGEKKSVKKQVKGRRDEARDWEWREADLEEVKDVWGEEEEFMKGGGGGVLGTGNSDGGKKVGGGGSGGGGVDGNGGKGDGAGVAGKFNPPSCKRWMIVTQKMVDEYSF